MTELLAFVVALAIVLYLWWRSSLTSTTAEPRVAPVVKAPIEAPSPLEFVALDRVPPRPLAPPTRRPRAAPRGSASAAKGLEFVVQTGDFIVRQVHVVPDARCLLTGREVRACRCEKHRGGADDG